MFSFPAVNNKNLSAVEALSQAQYIAFSPLFFKPRLPLKN